MVNLVTNELSEVIMNILKNSKDVMVEKGISEKWIKLNLTQYENIVSLSIEDNGGGISSEVLPKIFDKYFSTKDHSSGTGLGLYMSKKIIEESLGGKLEVTNTQNGALFTISFCCV